MPEHKQMPPHVLQAIIKADLSGHQRQILDLVIFKTYLEDRPAVSLSGGQVSEYTGLSEIEAARSLRTLSDRRILKAMMRPRGTRIGIYRVNENVETWLDRTDEPPAESAPASELTFPDEPRAAALLTQSDKKRANHDYHVLVENWFDGFYYFTQEAYPFTGRDGKHLRDLLKVHHYPLEKVQRLMVGFFQRYQEDEWMQEHGQLTVSFFRTKLPNLIAQQKYEEITEEKVVERLSRWSKLRMAAKKGG